ncbi:MAG: DUF6600 domain-containing protein [Casimicrobiaceae bacterium]
MKNQRHNVNRILALLVGVAVLAMTGLASADPPMRVARLGYTDGPVSFSPAGESNWVLATLNRPLVTGDRLWADAGARVELQIGTAAIRLGAATSVTLLNLDDRVAQLQLAEGTLNVRVRRLDQGQVIEIDTPNLAYMILRPGQYRISVDPNGNATEVRTAAGQAEVYGEGATYVVDAGRAYRFFGTDLRDYEDLAYPRIDEFDRWAAQRDRSYDSSISARYVSRDVIGYQDLDAYGTWRAVPEYGNVWFPARVRSDWAPYRDGHWAWVEPWGWTWVDDAPWGFAVSHYGRWASLGDRWGWVPGPVAARAVYAPALVAFIGGNNFQLSVASGGAVGWFALGPRDVYRPAYAVSRNYFTNVNVSNTTINNTYVTNVYNNTNVSNVTYANQQVRGAIIAVPTTAFVQSRPVARAELQVPRDSLARAPVNNVAAIAPTQVSVFGAASRGSTPPPQALERSVIARNAPPAAPVGFAAREQVLSRNPGVPVDAPALAGLRTSAPVPAPKVDVIAPARNAGPVAAPPPQGAQESARNRGEQAAPPQGAMIRQAQPQPAPQTAPSTQSPQRGLGLQQGGPSAPPSPSQGPAAASPPQRGAPPSAGVPPSPPQPGGKFEAGTPSGNSPVVVRPPQAPAPAPTAQPADTRGRPETRGQSVVPTPVIAPPAAVPPSPAVAPPPPLIRPPQGVAPPPTAAPLPPAMTRSPPVNAPAPMPAVPDQRNKPDAANQPRPPAAVAVPPVAPAPPEQQRGRPEPIAVPKPMPPASAPVAPAAGVPLPPRQAEMPPPGAPPVKVEPRANEPRSAGDKKRDDPTKGDEELKHR